MFYPLSALILTCIAYTAFTRGAFVALARSWMLAILSPCWIGVYVASAEIDLRLVAISAGLACMVVAGDWVWPKRLCWSDAIVVTLLVVQMVSEYQNDGFGLKSVFQICTTWGAPYLLGRFLFAQPIDLRSLQQVVATLTFVLSLWVISESLTKINVVNRVLDHQGSMQSETEPRWGFRRAEGPTSHPIFCGLLLVGLFPWTLQGAALAREGTGPSWWKWLPWLIAAAVFCTMSRGPQIALIMTFVGYQYFQQRQLRPIILTVACVGGCLAAVGREQLVAVLHSWSRESHQKVAHVSIGGVDYEYTGTTHRSLQYLVYNEALLRAGLFGYGSHIFSTKPVKVPYVEPHLMCGPFDSIDNHYIYFTLSAGHGGIGCFIALGVLSLWRLGRFIQRGDVELTPLASGLFAAQVAIMILVGSVWFSDDFGFQWLFNVGCISSWPMHATGHVSLLSSRAVSRRRIQMRCALPNASGRLATQRGSFPTPLSQDL